MSSTVNQWLIPFKGRNHSGATTQNFLWRSGNVYVMDNHRAALWCWLQEVSVSDRIGLLHIDEHYDTLCSRIDEWLEVLPELDGLSIDQYLQLEYKTESGQFPLVRWDNYLSLYLERYPRQVERSIFATHGVGDKPKVQNAMFVDAQQLAGNIESWMRSPPKKWIVNVDLDYFFCDQQGHRRPMFSEQYIESVFGEIQRSREAGRVACLTICLTPDEGYTGGWKQSEELCAFACRILGLPFQLPGGEEL